MGWRRQLAKFGALFRRPKQAADLDEEIRSHLRMEEQENLESGMPPDEAHYAALRRFGNVTLAQERSTQQGFESGLLEMLIRGQGSHNSARPHDYKRDAIRQSPFLIQPVRIELQPLPE